MVSPRWLLLWMVLRRLKGAFFFTEVSDMDYKEVERQIILIKAHPNLRRMDAMVIVNR